MGPAFSSTKVSVNDSVSATSSAINKNLMSCNMSSSDANKIIVDGNGNIIANTTQSIESKTDLDCVQRNINDQNFVTNVLNDAEQALSAEQKTDPISMRAGSFSYLHASSAMSTNLVQEQIQKSHQTCQTSLKGVNEIEVEGNENILDNIQQSSKLQNYAECLLTSQGGQSVVNNITNANTQTASTTQKGLFSDMADDFSKMLSGAGLYVVVFIVCIVAALAFGAAFWFHHHEKEKQRLEEMEGHETTGVSPSGLAMASTLKEKQLEKLEGHHGATGVSHVGSEADTLLKEKRLEEMEGQGGSSLFKARNSALQRRFHR